MHISLVTVSFFCRSRMLRKYFIPFLSVKPTRQNKYRHTNVHKHTHTNHPFTPPPLSRPFVTQRVKYCLFSPCATCAAFVDPLRDLTTVFCFKWMTEKNKVSPCSYVIILVMFVILFSVAVCPQIVVDY